MSGGPAGYSTVVSHRTYSTADAGSGEHDDTVRRDESADARRDENAEAQRLEREYPGAGADKPTEIPKKGWWQIVRRGLKEFSADQMPLMAAGVAFYAFLALVPTLIAATLVYGLVTTPDQVKQQVNSLASVLPKSAADLVGTQMLDLATAKSTGLGIGLVISLALALWSASGATGNLITAVNVAYDEKEHRNFIKKRGLALTLTAGAIIVFVVMTSLVAVFPAVANALHIGGFFRVGLEGLRWVVLLVVLMAALAVLYRFAPDRDDPKFRWTSVGAVAAVVIWVIASIAFSIYVSFGGYNKTYGALAGIVILLMWLWLSIVAILLGAEINAEMEKQTVRDTTTGPDKPLGERDAVKADLLPSDPDPDPETLKKR
jgi:membrane protein